MLPLSQTLGRLRTESGPMRYYAMESQLLFVKGTILYLSSIKPHSPTICFPSGNVGFLGMLWIWDMRQTLTTAPGDILFIHVSSNANNLLCVDGEESGFVSLVSSLLWERHQEYWGMGSLPPPANYHPWCVGNAVRAASATLRIGSFVHGFQPTLS